jgi:hypothetical protein
MSRKEKIKVNCKKYLYLLSNLSKTKVVTNL